VLLPLDLRRAGAGLHHSLSPYRSAVWPGLPFVMTIHDVIPLIWPDEYLRSGAVHRMLYRAARRARVLLAVSEATRRDAIAHLGADPARVRVVPEAAGERFAPADPGPVRARLALEGPYVLWMGGLDPPDPRKDVPGLVAEFARWRTREERRETLVLAGRIGEGARELERRAREGVRFVGFVPDEDLPGLLSGAACLLSASRYEGFGLPALEAISCGTPVVTFDGGAVPEVAGAGGLAVPVGDHAALLTAVGEVCDDAGLRARLSTEGRRHAAGYSWRRTAELTWDAYEQALSPSQGAGSRP
jgi:glycosyltransferase involved in cell wall biosynthesis